MSKINTEIYKACPFCGRRPHADTILVFECPSKSTELTVESLWTQPMATAAFNIGVRKKGIVTKDIGSLVLYNIVTETFDIGHCDIR